MHNWATQAALILPVKPNHWWSCRKYCSTKFKTIKAIHPLNSTKPRLFTSIRSYNPKRTKRVPRGKRQNLKTRWEWRRPISWGQALQRQTTVRQVVNLCLLKTRCATISWAKRMFKQTKSILWQICEPFKPLTRTLLLLLFRLMRTWMRWQAWWSLLAVALTKRISSIRIRKIRISRWKIQITKCVQQSTPPRSSAYPPRSKKTSGRSRSTWSKSACRRAQSSCFHKRPRLRTARLSSICSTWSTSLSPIPLKSRSSLRSNTCRRSKNSKMPFPRFTMR